tara:strand:+ start:224 stop:346 length:123 start_codon:yes stop_codon:yes gene_type:complete
VPTRLFTTKDSKAKEDYKAKEEESPHDAEKRDFLEASLFA